MVSGPGKAGSGLPALPRAWCVHGRTYRRPYCAAQSHGSASPHGNASAGLRSITPCRSLLYPPTQQPGESSEHGSLLSGNLCPSRVNSQCKSTGYGIAAPERSEKPPETAKSKPKSTAIASSSTPKSQTRSKQQVDGGALVLINESWYKSDCEIGK